MSSCRNKESKMISVLPVLLLLLFFVGVSETGEIFWKATNCESPLVYCARERAFTFCVDFKGFTVKWKFHFHCLTKPSCFYGDFPCKASPGLHQNTSSRRINLEFLEGKRPRPWNASTSSSQIDLEFLGSKRRPSSSVRVTGEGSVFASTEDPKIADGTVETRNATTSSTIPPNQTPPVISSEGWKTPSSVLDYVTTVPTTQSVFTTIKVAPPTACSGAGRQPGPSRSEYYECIAIWWWFDLRLRSCAPGFEFSAANRTCVPTARSYVIN